MRDYTYSRKQKRTYKSLLSWCHYFRGRGFQLFRLDLTSSKISEGKKMGENWQLLRRVIERRYHCRILYFKVETSEGHGVYHMVIAIKSDRPVYIPQKWLSKKWRKIHGAPIVYIKRVGKSGGHVRRIGKYFMEQYLAGQSAIVRVSWSWWRSGISIGKAFRDFYNEIRNAFLSGCVKGESRFDRIISYGEGMKAWTALLKNGSVIIAGAVFFINGENKIDVAYLEC